MLIREIKPDDAKSLANLISKLKKSPNLCFLNQVKSIGTGTLYRLLEREGLR